METFKFLFNYVSLLNRLSHENLKMPLQINFYKNANPTHEVVIDSCINISIHKLIIINWDEI